MKKFFYLAAVALVAFTASMSFTSCGDDDDDNPAASTTDTFKSATVTLSYEVSSDFLSLYDVTLKVTTPDGKTENIDLTSAGTKAYTTTSKDGQYVLSYNCVAKSGVTAEARKYDFVKNIKYTAKVTYASGKVTGDVAQTFGKSFNLLGSDMSVEGAFASVTKTFTNDSKSVTLTLKDGSFVTE